MSIENIEDLKQKLYKRFTTSEVKDTAQRLELNVSNRSKNEMIESIIKKDGSGNYKQLSRIFRGLPEKKEKEKESRKKRVNIPEEVKKKEKITVVKRRKKEPVSAEIRSLKKGEILGTASNVIEFKNSSSLVNFLTYAPIRGAYRRISDKKLAVDEQIYALAMDWGAKPSKK